MPCGEFKFDVIKLLIAPVAASNDRLGGSAGETDQVYGGGPPDPVSEAVQRDWGGYTGYFADPDGYRWEIAVNPGPVGELVLPD